MTDEQEKLLEAIRNALRSQPEKPYYEDYEQGNMSHKQYYTQMYKFMLVEEIKELLQN